MTSGPVTPARSSRVCRSVAIWSPSCGCGEGSLRPRPARSYTQTRVCVATAGAIHPQAARGSPEARLENDGGFTGSGAGQVQSVVAHVDELPGQRFCGCLVDGLRDGVDTRRRRRRRR